MKVYFILSQSIELSKSGICNYPNDVKLYANKGIAVEHWQNLLLEFNFALEELADVNQDDNLFFSNIRHCSNEYLSKYNVYVKYVDGKLIQFAYENLDGYWHSHEYQEIELDLML